MLKTFAITLFAVGLISAGCDSKPTHESVMKDSLAEMKELAEILKGVKDEASAKAAKPKIEKIGKRLEALKAESKKLGDPSAEEKKRLEEKYKTEMEQVSKDLFGEMMRIGFDPNLAPHLKDAMPKE